MNPVLVFPYGLAPVRWPRPQVSSLIPHPSYGLAPRSRDARAPPPWPAAFRPRRRAPGADGLPAVNGSFPEVLGVTLPVFLLVGLGVFLRRSDFLPESGESSLMRVIVTIFYPALILEAVGPARVVENPGIVALSATVGFFSIVIGFAVAWWVAPGFRLAVGSGRRTFAFSNGVYNFGYLPIPLVIAFFGPTDGTLAILFIHNVGVDLAFWSVGVLILQGTFNRAGFRRIVNPPLVALVAALVLNYTGLYAWLPDFVRAFLGYLADIAVPARHHPGRLLDRGSAAGRRLPDGLGDRPRGLSPPPRPAAPDLPRERLLIFPFPTELQRVVAIQAAMPAGLFPVVVTRFYGGRSDIAVRVAVGTLALSVLTTPLWIQFGAFVLGEK